MVDIQLPHIERVCNSSQLEGFDNQRDIYCCTALVIYQLNDIRRRTLFTYIMQFTCIIQ